MSFGPQHKAHRKFKQALFKQRQAARVSIEAPVEPEPLQKFAVRVETGAELCLVLH